MGAEAKRWRLAVLLAVACVGGCTGPGLEPPGGSGADDSDHGSADASVANGGTAGTGFGAAGTGSGTAGTTGASSFEDAGVEDDAGTTH